MAASATTMGIPIRNRCVESGIVMRSSFGADPILLHRLCLRQLMTYFRETRPIHRRTGTPSAGFDLILRGAGECGSLSIRPPKGPQIV